MAENITRCPKCGTSFRISDVHLQKAKGAVRCGSCLHIFNARENLVTPIDPEVSSAKIQIDEPREEIHRPEAPAERDDLLISDDMEAIVEEAPEQAPKPAREEKFSDEFNDSHFLPNKTGEYEFNLFEREVDGDDEEDSESQDESWALDLLKDEKPEIIERPTEEQLREEEERSITQEFDASYYKSSFQIVEEDAAIPEPTFKPVPQADTEERYEDDPYIEEIDYERSNSSNIYLDAIEPEPVEFNWKRHYTFWDSKLLWGALAGIAALFLFLQIAWIQFDNLNTVEPYRSYYAKACRLFGCQLPDLIDRSKIRTANLVVRSHPDVADALVVDAILQNNAKFMQTFPTLDLVFTDSQNRPVAARRLTPDQYLAGEMAGHTHMPVRQPVHIAIEVTDPGQQAVGYKISIAD